MLNINIYGKIRYVSFLYSNLKNEFQNLSKCTSHFSTSSSTLTKDAFVLERQAKMLNKLMNGSRRKWPSERDPVKKTGSSMLHELSANNNRCSNRRRIYNSILIRNISDVMSTGNLSHEFIGKGIEITGVKSTSDLSAAHIYYTCSLPVNYEEIGSLLNRNATMLRSQLCNLYVLGKVPQLIFVRDSYYENKEIMENLFAIADYGPDGPGLSDQQVASIEDNQDAVECNQFVSETDVDQSFICGERSSSKLKTNIYGLERNVMMIIVKQEMGSSKANSRLVEKDSESSRRNISSVELSNRSRVEKLAEFIKQQKRMKNLLKNQKENSHGIDERIANVTPYYKWNNDSEIEEYKDIYEIEDFEIDDTYKK